MADQELSQTNKSLRSIPTLAGLPSDEIKALREYMTRESYSPGGVIFTEGEAGDCLYIVESGLVEIVKKPADEFAGHVRLATRGSGEIIGEMAVIDDTPRFATAVCTQPTELLAMSRENFLRLLQSKPELALRVLQLMVSRVKETDYIRLDELKEKNRKLEDSAEKLHQAFHELKLSNQQLSDALQFRQRLLDVSPYPVVVTDAEMSITYCNPAVTTVFGFAQESSAGRKLDEIFGCLTREATDDIECDLRENGRWQGEWEVSAEDGKSVFCRVAAVPVLVDDGPPQTYLFIIHDETEIRFLQEQAANREHLASKGEMAAEVAHEMNNYLAVLVGNLELLPMFLQKGEQERIDKCLTTLHSSLERMQVFTGAMLSSRQLTKEKVRQDFNDYLQKQLAFLKPQRKFKKVFIEVELDRGLPNFEFDPNAFQQLLYNLILNSAEAVVTNDNTEPTVRISTHFDGVAGRAVLEIADNGPGIDPKIVGCLFKQRVTTRSDGHGIGLMIIKQIVDDHDGSITVGTSADGGALFSIELPIQVGTFDTGTVPIPTVR